MLKDNKILQYLKTHTPESKEEMYKIFPDYSEEIINYHLKNQFPNLLNDVSVDEKNDISVDEKPDKKGLRQKVINYMYDHPHADNKQVYEVFAGESYNTLRTYRNAALNKIQILIKQRELKEEKGQKDTTNKLLKRIENKSPIKNINHKKQQLSDNNKELNLETLKKKAYGDDFSSDNTKDRLSFISNLIDQRINTEIEFYNKKMDVLNEEVIKNTKSIKEIHQNFNKQINNELSVETIENILEKFINKNLEKIIKDKINQIISEKISKLGINIAKKALGNAFGGINLDSLLDGIK